MVYLERLCPLLGGKVFFISEYRVYRVRLVEDVLVLEEISEDNGGERVSIPF